MKSILLSLFICLSFSGCGSPDRQFISIGTGSQTGVYFPVGGVIKQIVEEESEGRFRVSVATSGGSVQNINDVLRGTVTFGIAQADRQYQAYHGLGNWEDAAGTDLRFAFSLHPEVITLVASDRSGIRSVQDLRGKRVNLGSAGSGHRGNAEDILGAAGIDPGSDLQAESLTAGELAGRLQDGQLDAYFFTVGHPNGSITEATTGRLRVRFVPIAGMETLMEASPFYTPTEVPVHLYPQALQEGPVPSIGMRTTVVVNAATSEETVYSVVSAVLRNLDALRQQHPALQGLTREGMLEGAHAPMHPGAARAFAEWNLTLP